MAGYTRQDTSNNIDNGNVIDAADLDAEFNQVESAFNSSTGHTHDGTSAEGAPITKVGPAQDLVVSATQVLPKTDNTLDLGSATYRFKQAYAVGFNGAFTGNLTGNVTGAVTGNADTATTLATGRTIALTGDVTATGVSFDGSANISLTTVVGNDSHNHTLAYITDAGTIASQNSNAVTITGGSISGITDLAVLDGGTGSSTAAGARTNLGVAIGSDVQAYDAGLASIAALTTAADKMVYTTALDTYAVTSLTSFARTLLDDADAATARTTLGAQASDATLTALAGLATGANKIPYSTGTDTFGQLDFLDEDDMASDSATAVSSQQATKAYVDNLALGVGQTWQDVTASRTASTAYQNTTGKPIEVKVITGSATLNHELQWSDDNVTYVTVSRSGSGSNLMVSTNSAVIPPNHYYKYTGSIAAWMELR